MMAGYPSTQPKGWGGDVMQRIVLACAAIALGLVGSPSEAQQAQPGDVNSPAPPVQESTPPAPEAYQLPPPPPFPPMPSKRPSHRWVDMGDHHAKRTHRASKPRHHQAARSHHKVKSSHHRRSAARPAKVHLSRKTIRQCHAMGYRQIMRHKNCRMLMKQEIAAADKKHASKARKAKSHKSRHQRVRSKHRRK